METGSSILIFRGRVSEGMRRLGYHVRRAEALRFAPPTGLNDQLPLNAARCELGIPLKWLDRRYNWLGFGLLVMPFLIYLAGVLTLGPYEGGLLAFLGSLLAAFFTAKPDETTGNRTGLLVEFDRTKTIFSTPADDRTEAYISGRFG